MDRVYLKHKETGGTTEVVNDPDVLADFADRGWLPAERPAIADVFIPHPSGFGQKELDASFYGTYDGGGVADENTDSASQATTGKGE